MICPSEKACPCQRKWEARSIGALVIREPTMNRRCAASSSARFVAEHPGVGDHDHVGQIVALLEGLDDRQDRGGFGFVAFEAADLQREPGTVDQQPDHDLRIDAAFLGIADLAQPVFLLSLEIQRRDVVEHQRDVPAREACSKHNLAMSSR